MQLDFVILGTLAMRRSSGYDLGRAMDLLEHFIGYSVRLPQIYRRLGGLVEQGLIEYDVDPRDGRPDAKVYRLTEAGHRHLLEWARSPHQPVPRISDPDFRIRLVFAGRLDRRIAIDVVRTELDYRLKHANPDGRIDLAAVSGLNPQIPEIDPAFAREIHLHAHEWGYTMSRAYITWLQLTLARLEATADPRPGSGAPGEA